VLSLSEYSGLFHGVAVTCRQYNCVVTCRRVLAAYKATTQVWGRERSGAGDARIFLSLHGRVPVLLLVLAWKGISSPGMQAGILQQEIMPALAELRTGPINCRTLFGLYSCL